MANGCAVRTQVRPTPEDCIHGLRGFALHGRRVVAVDAERHGGVRVAETLGYDSDVCPGARATQRQKNGGQNRA